MKGRLILRITAASIVSGLLLCSPSFSQTVDISSLTETEQSVHRASHCYALQTSLNFTYPNDWAVTVVRIAEIKQLLEENGFLKRQLFVDTNDVGQKAANDVKAALILGDLEVTLEMLTDCAVDMVSILKNEYIPNFSYMNN